MVLRDAPEVVRTANVEMLLVDEADFAGTWQTIWACRGSPSP